MIKKTLFWLTFIILAGTLAIPGRSSAIDLGLEHDDINRDFWFARDKCFHWGASAILTLSSYCVYDLAIKTNASESVILSSGFTLVIGLAKEDFDKNEKKTFFSYKDLAADGAGIATGLLIIGLCKNLF